MTVAMRLAGVSLTLVVGHGIVLHDLAAEHPHLHAAGAVGRVRGGAREIDVGAQRVQGHATLAVPFAAGDLRSAEPTAAGHLDALGAQAHRRLHRTLHGTAEGDAAGQLLRDVLGDQLGVELGLADLVDVEVHIARCQGGQLLAEHLDLLALLADHPARPGGVDRDPSTLGGALDDDPADAGLGQALLDEGADLEILGQQLGVAAIIVPTRIPGPVDPQAQTDRIDFLAHQAASFSVSTGSTFSRTTIRSWLTCFSILPDRPRARACMRFITRCLPTLASATNSRSTSRLWLFSAFAIAD